MSKMLFALAAALLIAAGAAAQTKPVAVTQAWARATPDKAENGAAYLTLDAATADRLNSISTPAAKKAELHTMTMQGNVMKMRPLDGIDLPAGQKITLKPGSMHIMLLGLTERLRPGQSFPLTLHFATAGDQQVTVSVEAAGAMGPPAAAGTAMPMPTPAGR